MSASDVCLQIVLKLPLLDLPVLAVDFNDLVKRPRSVVHSADHAADVIHPDLVEVELLDLTADVLNALRVPGDVDVPVEVVRIVVVHIHEERHWRVVQDHVASLSRRGIRILNHDLVAPAINHPQIFQPAENVRLVMVALDNELPPVEMRKNLSPILKLIGPNHVAKNVDEIVGLDSCVPKFNHLAVHVLDALPRTVVVTNTIKMLKMCI